MKSTFEFTVKAAKRKGRKERKKLGGKWLFIDELL